MQAAQINSYGDARVIEVVDISQPTPKEGQITVQVKAASINAFDYKLMSGIMQKMIPLTFPITIGGDFSGVVMEVGSAQVDVKKGDSIYGQAIVLTGATGSMAEFLCVSPGSFSTMPTRISFEDGAALPLVGVSAVQALEEHINLQSGQKILIHGGAGGIGHIAIQLAKAIGAYVATTVSEKDMEFASSLGADEVLNYQTQQFENLLKEYDAVFDTVGGPTLAKSVKVLKKGGILVSMLGKPDESVVKEYGVTAIGQQTRTTPERLTRLAALVESGKIKVHIDSIFSLRKVQEAFQKAQNGHPQGKVVIKIQE